MKILIVQPHSDDALFSASHFLFDKKYATSVLTIENNSKRIAEDEELYKFLGIPYQHLNVEFDDQSFYGFYKKYSEANWNNSVEHLIEFFGKEKLVEIEKEVRTYIGKFVKKNPDAQIVVPWGIGHPMHCFISHIIHTEAAICMAKPLWYYRDFPHSYKKRAAVQVTAQLEEYKLLEEVDVRSFHDVKWELAKKFYKTQSGFLWFEQGYIRKQLPEEIYVKK